MEQVFGSGGAVVKMTRGEEEKKVGERQDSRELELHCGTN